MQELLKQKMRTINAAGCAAVAVILASTVSFGIVPLYKNGAREINETARLQAQLSALDGLSQTLNQVEEDRKQTENRLKEVEKRLPSSSETNVFIGELAKVTRAAGIQVEATTYPKDLKDSGGYKALPVEVVGTGDWESCYRFLTGLRSMHRLTRLDSLTLETTDQQETLDHPICRITVKFSTFFMTR